MRKIILLLAFFYSCASSDVESEVVNDEKNEEKVESFKKIVSDNYDINNIDYIEKTCNIVMELMKNEIKKKDYLNRAHLWAKQLDIQNIKNKWLGLINN